MIAAPNPLRWSQSGVPFGLPFASGDRMDQATFHEQYLTTPAGVKAELIGGIVYVASPVTSRHGRPQSRLNAWLGLYSDETEGTDPLDNTSNILGQESEPQPDVCLRLLPEYGGQSAEDEGGYIIGPAELVIEVANTTASIDLHAKKQDYETAKVREYLVVLPQDLMVMWFQLGRLGYSQIQPSTDGIIRSRIFPGLWLDPQSLFAPTTRRLFAVLREGLRSSEHATFVAKLKARAAKRHKKG